MAAGAETACGRCWLLARLAGGSGAWMKGIDRTVAHATRSASEWPGDHRRPGTILGSAYSSRRPTGSEADHDESSSTAFAPAPLTSAPSSLVTKSQFFRPIDLAP